MAAARAQKKEEITKMPSEKKLEKMRQEDQGYVLAGTDAVKFIQGRRQAVYNIARHYHLEPEELMQEAYEVLLTCLRDYMPVYEKNDGKFVSVQFTTFFGNRMETRAMEMRNRDPEYQARQAYTDGMDDDERTKFRSDPPLLVQHLDHEHALQEALRSEATEAHANLQDDVALKVVRDTFFEKKLNELVAAEKDEKKKAALLHVKVGGVYNFQEIAYHFGVTDSRASQVMNELMDAFYVQRILDGNLSSVSYDFKKLKFNEKRTLRLLEEALQNATEQRAKEILSHFSGDFEGLAESYNKQKKAIAKQQEVKEKKAKKAKLPPPPAYEDVLTDEENEQYPLVSVDVRPIKQLKEIDMPFRPPVGEEEFEAFCEAFDVDSSLYPAVVSEEGYIIDGAWRVRAAKAKGRDSYLCITRRIPKDVDRRELRIKINQRLKKPTKIEYYYAIGALAEIGYSQQKIADVLGISRTNVLVYAKVREKATPKLRALFEDGLIQITNASTCTDLSDAMQGNVADFIRKYGPEWSKGNRFNDLYLAASQNKLEKLAQSLEPVDQPEEEQEPGKNMVVQADDRAVKALNKRLEAYEQALKDAEVWSAQREKIIANQTELLSEARGEVDALKKELDAAELMRFGSPQAVEAELKELKKFYAFCERLSGAGNALEKAVKDLRRLDLKRKQALEVDELMDSIGRQLNALRVEMINQGHKQRAQMQEEEKEEGGEN